MPRVRFTAPFDWKPRPQVTQAYRAGFEGMVTTPCAAAAVNAGKAVKIKRKAKADVVEQSAL